MALERSSAREYWEATQIVDTPEPQCGTQRIVLQWNNIQRQAVVHGALLTAWTGHESVQAVFHTLEIQDTAMGVQEGSVLLEDVMAVVHGYRM